MNAAVDMPAVRRRIRRYLFQDGVQEIGTGPLGFYGVE
jgi:hypothetical protein